MKKIKVFTSFSGYDSQCLALEYLGIDYELVGWSEIDKYAIKAHNILFPQYSEKNYGDITDIKWNEVPDFDFFTYSPPCQDFSIAGKQSGGTKGSGTRSSLLWECERAIKEKRPKYLLMENVAALVSKKFIKTFNEWQLTLNKIGYVNYCKILNSKNYGVPQNRKRIFLVSIRNDIAFPFYFPKKIRLEKKLKDILEDNVEEKYYISDFKIKSFMEECKSNINNKTIITAILEDKKFGNEQNKRVFDINGISPTCNTFGGGNQEIKILLGWSRDKKGNIINRHKVDIANEHTNYVDNGYRIRKLTPSECFRLMGVKDTDIQRLTIGGGKQRTVV